MEQRTVGVGVLAKDIARDFSPVGPMIRGSGFARDVSLSTSILWLWRYPFQSLH